MPKITVNKHDALPYWAHSEIKRRKEQPFFGDMPVTALKLEYIRPNGDVVCFSLDLNSPGKINENLLRKVVNEINNREETVLNLNTNHDWEV